MLEICIYIYIYVSIRINISLSLSSGRCGSAMGVVMVLEGAGEFPSREQKKLNIDGGGGGNISRRPSSPCSVRHELHFRLDLRSSVLDPRASIKRKWERNERARKSRLAKEELFPPVGKWMSGERRIEGRKSAVSHRRRSIENSRKGIRLDRSPSAVRPHLCTLPSSLSVTSGEFPALLAFANPHTRFKRCY